MSQQYFIECYCYRLWSVENTMIGFMSELINFRDSYLAFSTNFNFNHFSYYYYYNTTPF